MVIYLPIHLWYKIHIPYIWVSDTCWNRSYCKKFCQCCHVRSEVIAPSTYPAAKATRNLSSNVLPFEILGMPCTDAQFSTHKKTCRKKLSAWILGADFFLLTHLCVFWENGWKKPTPFLVGGFNPSEKYARQIGHLPQIGVNIKNIFETTTQHGILSGFQKWRLWADMMEGNKPPHKISSQQKSCCPKNLQNPFLESINTISNTFLQVSHGHGVSTNPFGSVNLGIELLHLDHLHSKCNQKYVAIDPQLWGPWRIKSDQFRSLEMRMFWSKDVYKCKTILFSKLMDILI